MHPTTDGFVSSTSVVQLACAFLFSVLIHLLPQSWLLVHICASPLHVQVWTGNMSKAGEAKIAASADDYTKVSFKPDLPKFGMECLTRDMVALLTRRVYDLAGCLTGVKVYLNGKRIPVSEI